MCGVVAHYSPAARVDPDRIDAACAALAHRGPDGRGRWLARDRTAGLGHTRLAVIDLDGGAQPMTSTDGDAVAVVNGELYGFADIRARLEVRGHRFRSRCDSEIAVHLYAEHGLDFARHLRGEFAVVIWDRARRRLVAARDRFGIKPLCFAEHRGDVVVASEAKGLFALGLPAAWDDRGLAHALCHQYLPPGLSLFAGVRQLEPGAVLVADDGGVTISRYWDLDYPVSPAPCSADEATAVVAAALDEAVAVRLRADVPIAFHLSGGLDSSAVAGLAARHGAGAGDVFCVQFDSAAHDELGHAATVAGSLAAALHPVPVSRAAMIDALPAATYFSESLSINGQLAAKLILNRAVAAAGLKVVLGGEGADEVFGGYAHLRRDWGAAAAATAALQTGIMLPGGAPIEIPVLAERLGFVPSFLAAKLATGRALGALRATAATPPTETELVGALLDRVDVQGQLRGRRPAIQSAILWTRLALPGYILRAIGDGTEMACGVEARLPFLDHVLFERVRNLRPELVFSGAIEKELLRRAVAGAVPETIARRPKQPFLAPPMIDEPRALELVRELAGASPLFDRAAIDRFCDRATAADPDRRRAADPIAMSALTAALLEARFGLTDIRSRP